MSLLSRDFDQTAQAHQESVAGMLRRYLADAGVAPASAPVAVRREPRDLPVDVRLDAPEVECFTLAQFVRVPPAAPTTGWGAIGRIASSVVGNMWADKADAGLREQDANEHQDGSWARFGRHFSRRGECGQHDRPANGECQTSGRQGVAHEQCGVGPRRRRQAERNGDEQAAHDRERPRVAADDRGAAGERHGEGDEAGQAARLRQRDGVGEVREHQRPQPSGLTIQCSM